MSATEKAPASVRELMERYDEAWNAHDLDPIMALQTPDSSFKLRGAGATRVWEGADACREAYGYLLQAVPDQHLVRTLEFVGEGIYVANHDFRGTFALPWETGGKTFQPTGQPVSWPGRLYPPYLGQSRPGAHDRSPEGVAWRPPAVRAPAPRRRAPGDRVPAANLTEPYAHCERNLVRVKDGWIDGCAVAQQLEAQSA